jgi:hypothetical protein
VLHHLITQSIINRFCDEFPTGSLYWFYGYFMRGWGLEEVSVMGLVRFLFRRPTGSLYWLFGYLLVGIGRGFGDGLGAVLFSHWTDTPVFSSVSPQAVDDQLAAIAINNAAPLTRACRPRHKHCCSVDESLPPSP